MFTRRFPSYITVVAALASVLAACLVLSGIRADENQTRSTPVPDKSYQKELTGLLEKLRDALREEIKERKRVEYDWRRPRIVEARRLLLETELALTDKPEERDRLYQDFDDSLKEIEKVRLGFRERTKTEAPWLGLEGDRLRARIAQLRERAGKSPSAEQSAEIRKNLEELRDFLRKERDSQIKWTSDLADIPNTAGHSALDGCPESIRRELLEVEQELAKSRKERLDLLEAYLDKVKANFDKMTKTDEFNAFPPPDQFPTEAYAQFEALRWDAEIQLLRAQMEGGKPAAEETQRLKELQQKRRSALEESINARREIVTKGFSHYTALTLEVLVLRLHGELEKEPADAVEPWFEFSHAVEDLQRAVNKLDKCDHGVKPMVEAARLWADVNLMRIVVERKAKRGDGKL